MDHCKLFIIISHNVNHLSIISRPNNLLQSIFGLERRELATPIRSAVTHQYAETNQKNVM